MHSTMNLGGCVVSKNILEKRGRLKWCFREESVNNIDNGWRFLSEIDTDEFLADSKNMVICDWGTIFVIETANALFFELPIGTELTLEYDGSQKCFVESETGEKLIFYPELFMSKYLMNNCTGEERTEDDRTVR